jgi:hypothetical protein
MIKTSVIYKGYSFWKQAKEYIWVGILVIELILFVYICYKL